MSWKVYVLHFDKPYKHAKHYTGIAENVEARVKRHERGQGARLTKVLKANNIGFRYAVVKEFETFSEAHKEERRLKHSVKKPQRYCPFCVIGE